jgi:hypothetical protein
LNNFVAKKKFKNQNMAFSKGLLRPNNSKFSVELRNKRNNLYFFSLKLLYGTMEIKFNKFFISNAVNFCFRASSKNSFLSKNLVTFFKKKKTTSLKLFLFSTLVSKFIKIFSFFFKKKKNNYIELYSPTGEEPPLFFKDKYLIKPRLKNKAGLLTKVSINLKKNPR